ncbi:hypothetical protein BGZ61DRAFT_341122 [Ilyonectria robusta]|uniref:uncharacterized protein n=1 Tax=Ilyonectria robusta TaxID=1079257 RepID=UPI001E8D90B1|nr:uncharacterized protein BGZ61DRAFT_341122 [Ilyonectria robusta]KAH8736591.1 hypothetical protein BGZ61DRAFT_341122 [Ilyonectria robusta]
MEKTQKVSAFREYIPPQDSQRSIELAKSDTYEWAKLRCNEPFMVGWMQKWDKLLNEPYKGISVDGSVISNLYRLGEESEDLGAPTSEMVEAAQSVLDIATPEQREALCKPIDAPEWRCWINPEIYIFRNGVRLEEVSKELVDALHALMRASLSQAGYEKAVGCMNTNQFLGEVVNGKRVLNRDSYNFVIFGTPSEKEPWGWQLYGHHLDLNVFVVGKQMVVSPVFLGAEPNVIDAGPYKGTELFTDQELVGLKLMQSMDKAEQSRVRIFNELSGPEYPESRFHRADQRHLGGAFQDNRVIPYEGVKVTGFSTSQQDLVRRLLVLSLSYLPEKALAVKMKEISHHWEDTYFCWIGGCQVGDAFYYKVHSPVVMAEFDHHSGVFLNNKVPLPFHIHTLVRTPNGNDYGKELLKQIEQRRDSTA